jgi:hypothetical protein
MRKELLAFAGLSLCAVAAMQERQLIFWLGVLLLCISFLSHEAMVLFVPTFLGIILISGLHKIATKQALVASIIVLCFALLSVSYAIKYSQVPDTSLICTPLIERGLNQSICSGAIAWLGYDSAFGFQQVTSSLNTKSLGGFLIAYAAALAPFLYLIIISKRPLKIGILLIATALPFLPLYFIAVDWGRWMSFHVFSVTILIACALRKKLFQYKKNPSRAYIFLIAAISLSVTPQHTIGIHLGGVFRRAAVELWRIFT